MFRTFELTLSKDYAKNWGLQEALREIIQNAIDFSNEEENNIMSINYDEETSTLSIANNSILTKKTLLLGYTSKEDNPNSIGCFGEGYKLSLLVLNRLQKDVTIYNYGKKEIWTTKFVKSSKYEGEFVLKVIVDTEPIWRKVPNNNLTFEIKGISKEDYEELLKRTLQLQGYINFKNASDIGRILMDVEHQGKLFVNGLWIKDIPSLKYGYDITPSYLKIGRDRDLVSEYDISVVTSAMWALNQGEELFNLISENALDIKCIDTSLNYDYRIYDKLNKYEIYDNVYDNFKEKYGENSIPSSSQRDREILEKSYPNSKIITVSNIEKTLITSSNKYKEEISSKKISNEVSISELYENWLSEYGYTLQNKAKEELSNIINIAKERIKE